jgi:hypothetical protein
MESCLFAELFFCRSFPMVFVAQQPPHGKKEKILLYELFVIVFL